MGNQGLRGQGLRTQGDGVRLLPPRRPPAPPAALDPVQALAVAHRQGQGPLVVLGGPGTGTTTVLVESVVARVDRDGVPAEGVLVLAPTRLAAGVLRDRVSARLRRTVREPLARTPHSFAFGLLRRARVLDGDAPPRLISGPEQDRILADLLAGHESGAGRPVDWPESVGPQVRALRGFRHELRDVLMRAVERGLDGPALADLGRRTGRPEWVAAAEVLEEYLEVTSLATPGAFDPAAIVDAAVGLLADDPDLLAAERERWALVAVDDAQELTAAGGRLVELLVAGGRDAILVGDPDAATQTFRGASPALLAHAADRLRTVDGGPARVLVLPTVHRHGPALRAVAQRVAARIGALGGVAHRAAGPADPQAAGTVAVHVLASAAQEAAFVAGELRRRHLGDQVPWSAMAVVVRSTRSTEALRRALGAAGVPVAVPVAEVPVRDEPAVVPLRLALRAVLDPAGVDPDVAVTLLSGPVGAADALALRRLRQGLRAQELAAGGGRGSDALLVEALTAPAVLAGLEPAVARPALRVAAVLAAGAAAAATPGATAESVLWAIWDATGLADGWRRTALSGGTSGARADRDLDAVVALFEAAARFVDRMPRAGADAFLDHLDGEDLPSDTLAERAPSDEAVALVTAQGAAGSEWDVVAVPGVQEGLWPDLRLRTSLLGAQALADLVDGRAAGGAASVLAQRRAVLEDELRLFHVAVSRARRHLLVTAVRSDDELPSVFLDLVDPADPVAANPADSRQGDSGQGDELRPLTAVQRTLTLPALVAELRAVVCDDRAEEHRRRAAARELARLADAGVPGADPDQWYGLAEVSSTEALREPGAAVAVSPSKVESFERCPLRWLLTTGGGSKGSSASQALGTLVHEIAHEVPGGDEGAMRALLAQRFDRLGLGEGWFADTQRARAEQMVARLAEYCREAASAGRRLLATEVSVQVEVGRAVVRGQVDRLEQDAQGRLYVVDLKTGKGKPTKEELARHAQLGVYQLAVEEGGFDPVTGAPGQSGGAALVQLGGTTKAVSVQGQRPLGDDDDPAWARHLVETVAEGMAGADFPARENPMCRMCDVRRSCPTTPQGRTVGQ